jgi:hypothetical protein
MIDVLLAFYLDRARLARSPLSAFSVKLHTKVNNSFLHEQKRALATTKTINVRV